jgi:hypothetical protein
MVFMVKNQWRCDLFEQVVVVTICRRERLVSKRRDRPYRGGRSKDWVKTDRTPQWIV